MATPPIWSAATLPSTPARAVVVAAALLITPAARAGSCPTPATAAQVQRSLAQAETAWRAADEATFQLRMEEVLLQLPCLDAVVAPRLAARVHRGTGLWLFANGDAEQASAAFSSARRVAPDVPLPADLLPATHPARALFDQSAPDPTTSAPPPPARGALRFDGADSGSPTAGPTIAQLVVEGPPVFTAYLRPDQDLPAYAVAATPDVTQAPSPEPVPVAPKKTAARGGALGWSLAAGAGALAVGSGVSALVARGKKQTFEDQPPGNRSDLDALYESNRRASTASAVLFGGAGLVGAAAVIAW